MVTQIHLVLQSNLHSLSDIVHTDHASLLPSTMMPGHIIIRSVDAFLGLLTYLRKLFRCVSPQPP